MPDLNLTKPHFSAKVYKSYFHYLRTRHPDVDIRDLCLSAGLPYEYLADEANWVSVSFDRRFTQLCIERTGDPRICFHAGAQQYSEEVIGRALHYISKHAVSLQFVYSRLPHIVMLFSNVTRLYMLESKRGFAHFNLIASTQHLTDTEIADFKDNLRNIFENTIGHLTALPTYQKMPQAVVEFEEYMSASGVPSYDIRVSFTPSQQVWQTLLLVGAAVTPILTGLCFLLLKFSPGIVLSATELSLGIFLVLFFMSKYSALKAGFNSSIENLGRLDQRYFELHRVKEDIIKLSQSYSRFVPREFLHLLNQKSIVDVKLGDTIDAEMTILFSDIRNFTTLSEPMDPRDNFAFLNSFLQRMTPAIKRHGGFIDKYIGDAIMAVFPKDPTEALEAALEMIHILNTYNSQRRYKVPIEVGIGLNTGRMILGILGSPEYMQNTVVSDSVNTASRLQDFTRAIGASIIVGGKTLDLAKAKRAYKSRYLGKLPLKGKEEMVASYEIYESDLPEKVKAIDATLQTFEEAVRLNEQGDLKNAELKFKEVLQLYPSDKAAAYFLSLIERKTNPPFFKDPSAA